MENFNDIIMEYDNLRNKVNNNLIQIVNAESISYFQTKSYNKLIKLLDKKISNIVKKINREIDKGKKELILEIDIRKKKCGDIESILSVIHNYFQFLRDKNYDVDVTVHYGWNLLGYDYICIKIKIGW